MKILNPNNECPKNVSLILGFFDGIHLGHKEVIKSAVKDKVIVTFKDSPAKFFGKNYYYIYPREKSYELAEALGVKYILEYDFSDIANMSAEEYLNMLIEKFAPYSISTGFNHTFGKNKSGNIEVLKEKKKFFGYKYFYVPEYKINQETVSSSSIKNLLTNGELEKANKFLDRNFSITSKVIHGQKLGREIGFPTANLKYPSEIVRLPYGVYTAKVLDVPAVLNWGMKPTVNGNQELLEVHIPNYDDNLYDLDLEIEIIKKIRDEKKFNSIDELKFQISEDVKQCLK